MPVTTPPSSTQGKEEKIRTPISPQDPITSFTMESGYTSLFDVEGPEKMRHEITGKDGELTSRRVTFDDDGTDGDDHDHDDGFILELPVKNTKPDDKFVLRPSALKSTYQYQSTSDIFIDEHGVECYIDRRPVDVQFSMAIGKYQCPKAGCPLIFSESIDAREHYVKHHCEPGPRIFDGHDFVDCNGVFWESPPVKSGHGEYLPRCDFIEFLKKKHLCPHPTCCRTFYAKSRAQNHYRTTHDIIERTKMEKGEILFPHQLHDLGTYKIRMKRGGNLGVKLNMETRTVEAITNPDLSVSSRINPGDRLVSSRDIVYYTCSMSSTPIYVEYTFARRYILQNIG